MINNTLFNKIEKKTNINKETIINLANKLQNNNMKDEKTIKEIIDELCKLTGKTITKEKEEKILNTILNDKVPKNIDKMF